MSPVGGEEHRLPSHLVGGEEHRLPDPQSDRHFRYLKKFYNLEKSEA